MAKNFFKSILLGIIVFCIAILAGYLSYAFTYRYQAQRLAETVPSPELAQAAPAYGAAQPLREEAADYYLARFEQNDIAVYTVSQGKEAFLYTLGVYAEDLPAADLIRLREGVVLQDRQELAAFEEDYGS